MWIKITDFPLRVVDLAAKCFGIKLLLVAATHTALRTLVIEYISTSPPADGSRQTMLMMRTFLLLSSRELGNEDEVSRSAFGIKHGNFHIDNDTLFLFYR